MHKALAAFLALMLFQPAAVVAQRQQLKHRWVYSQTNLLVDRNVQKTLQLIDRAAEAGYNGIVIADFKLNILKDMIPRYFRNLDRVLARARSRNLEVIPAVVPVGYSEGILRYDPNLAEGLPCRNVPFRIRGRTAQLAAGGKNLLKGGSFSRHRNHRFAGWAWSDLPGKASFADGRLYHSEPYSLRFEDLAVHSPEHGNGRVSQEVEVEPWRQCHSSVWLRTEGFDSARNVRILVLGQDGRQLSYSNLGVKPTQDWTQHHIVFNSLANERVRFYIGVWGGRGGKLWIDDAVLEETAFVNLLRRPGCPLRVRGPDGIVYVEGRDYLPIADPKMGRVPYAGCYDVYHQPPELKLTRNSRIRDGQALLIDYYHTVTIYDGQVTCCLGEDRVFEIIEEQVRRVQAALRRRTYFLSYDEIRVANWCKACNRPGRTAGRLLAEHVRKVAAIVRKIDPDARLCIWSDMFDPYHNARDRYYLVNGDLRGSWEGLDRGMIVVNWNRGRAAKSLAHFEARGHEQVLAGYYDGDPSRIKQWLQTASRFRGVSGVMYTTWRDDFSKIEQFARYAWRR